MVFKLIATSPILYNLKTLNRSQNVENCCRKVRFTESTSFEGTFNINVVSQSKDAVEESCRKSLDRTRNDPWLNGLNCLVWQDITYIILIHFLPNSHICVFSHFIFTYVTQL